MEERSLDTLERIQQAALEEFSEKGFLGASLRQIVKNAGGDHWGFLWLLFQQGSTIRCHRRTPRH